MKVVTAAHVSGQALKSWRRQYKNWPAARPLAFGELPKAIEEKIAAANGDPALVAAATGSQGWAYPQCNVCSEYVGVALSLGDNFGGDDTEVLACRACLDEAVAMIEPFADQHGPIEDVTEKE